MSIRENTLEEQEKEEEEELANNLYNLNLSYKERDSNEFINSLTHLSKDSNFGFLPKSSRMADSIRPFSLTSIDNFSFEKWSNVSTNDCGKNLIMESFLLQNLEIYDEVLKIMVLGDNSTGKSLLISTLLNKPKTKYIPTTNLEIHHRVFKHFGKFVKLKLFDTNANILKDSLMKSILFLNLVYYKLSNGYILLCNKDDMNSVKYIETQLEYILSNHSFNKKIMILCNKIKKANYITQSKITEECEEYLKRISERFDIKVHYIDVNEVSIEDFLFQKLFDLMLISRNDEKHHKTSKVNKRKLTRVYSSTELTECLPDTPSVINRHSINETTCKLHNSKECKIL